MKKSNIFFLGMLMLTLTVWYYIYAFTNVFYKNNNYYSFYNNIKGLQVSSPIYYKGVKVGTVSDISINNNRKVEVSFSIKKELKIPNGTIANVTSGDLSGNKAVILLFSNEKGIISNGGYLIPSVDSSMVENFNAKITPIIHHGKVLLKIADSGLHNFNSFILETFAKESKSVIYSLGKNIDNFKQNSASINNSTNEIIPKIQTVDNSLSGSKEKNESLNQTIHNSNTSTSKIKNIDFKEDLEKFRKSSQELSSNLKKINSNISLNSNKTYENAHKQIDSFHQSLKEYQKNPPALIHLFGDEKKH